MIKFNQIFYHSQRFKTIVLTSFLLWTGCSDSPANQADLPDRFPEKGYSVDETGHILSTEMSVADFEPSSACQECHPQHYAEWQQSMHAYAMQDPVFFSGWTSEQLNRPETGERFCLQCHNPVAFMTGVSLEGFGNATEFMSSDQPEVVKDGIGCDICHSVTGLSHTVITGNSVNGNAEYHVNPGEGIKYGSLETPGSTSAHRSRYTPIYSRSEICLPCHDFVIRGVEAEITFTEWNRIPGLAMSGGLACQACHMTPSGDGHHDHRFIGVDLDLTQPAESSPVFGAVQNLLQTALEISVGQPDQNFPDTIHTGEALSLPFTVTSLTAHSVPSGVSFAREAWLELTVTHDGELLFQSGKIETPGDHLDTSDPQLLLFKTQLLDDSGNPISGVTDTHGIINATLGAFSRRYHTYAFTVPAGINGELQVSARMRFRAFYPSALEGSHEDLLDNLPVFEMASLTKTIIAQ